MDNTWEGSLCNVFFKNEHEVRCLGISETHLNDFAIIHSEE